MNNKSNSFLSNKELKKIGFSKVGKNVLISRFARFYDISKISIGDNVRIDDFSILSGKIVLGNFIHISAFCALYAAKGIEMQDFTGLSPQTIIFSASDDFSGQYLIGPMVKKEYTNVTGGKVTIGKYSQIGSNCVLLPKIKIGEGVAVGALSLVNESLASWGIYAGIPAKFIKPRSRELQRLEKQLIKSMLQ